MLQESVRDIVIGVIRSVAEDARTALPELQGSARLDELGFDSLDWAVVVAKLEDKLGFDPFLEGLVTTMPRTVDEFIACYDRRVE